MKKLAGFLFAALLPGLALADAPPRATRALAIVTPVAARTIVEGAAVMISVAPSPALAEGEAIIVRVDDEFIVVLPPGLTQVAISGVPSGTHVLEAIIVDADQNLVAAAEIVTFRIDPGLRA